MSNRAKFRASLVMMGAMFLGFTAGAIFDSTFLWRISVSIGLVGVLGALVTLWDELHPEDRDRR